MRPLTGIGDAAEKGACETYSRCEGEGQIGDLDTSSKQPSGAVGRCKARGDLETCKGIGTSHTKVKFKDAIPITPPEAAPRVFQTPWRPGAEHCGTPVWAPGDIDTSGHRHLLSSDVGPVPSCSHWGSSRSTAHRSDRRSQPGSSRGSVPTEDPSTPASDRRSRSGSPSQLQDESQVRYHTANSWGRFGEERSSACRHFPLLLNSHVRIAFGIDHKPRLALRASVSKRWRLDDR